MTRARKPTRNYKSRKINICSWVTELDISDSNLSHNPCNRARMESNRHIVPGPPKGVIGLLLEISRAGILQPPQNPAHLVRILPEVPRHLSLRVLGGKKMQIVSCNLPKGTLGNSSKKLLDRRLLFFCIHCNACAMQKKKSFVQL